MSECRAKTGSPSHLRGHSIKLVHKAFHGGYFVYCDTLEPTAGNRRPCKMCGEKDTPEGHDPCLGTLPGVMNACCGHGVESECYVQLVGGKCLRGNDAMALVKLLEKAE